MALLEDPTIQRILDEVNKAASGGVLGTAGNYVSEPINPMAQYPSHVSSSEKNFFSQDQAPLFYPTPEMFDLNELAHFNAMPSMAPMTTSNNFDIYSSGIYNTMPQNYLSPFEQYNGMTKSNAKNLMLDENNILRSTSTVSSVNHDLLFEHHRHQEYPTMPNLGLNIRTTTSTSQVDSIPGNIPDVNHIQLTPDVMPKEMTNSVASTVNAPINNNKEGEEEDPTLPSMNNEDVDRDNPNSTGQIFYDPNPQVIQRKGAHSVTYKQNIIVRFLQPPAIPNAGPLIIKEVRPPPTPALPPLVIKQRPTPPRTPPPLVIREKPPPLPTGLAPKVITRQLPPEPAPPRAVIIERLPPLPPKPRDIIIERWLPYEIINQKRKVVVQRAQKSSQEHLQPKNIIITYEPVHAKIIRNFQKQNIVREDPQAYVNLYGSQLYDPKYVIEQARAAGVMEDLNPPMTVLSAMTTNVMTGTDYELSSATTMPTTVPLEKDQHEQIHMENNEKEEDNHPRQQQQDEGLVQALSTTTVHAEENAQEEDVLVEENVTPFYMNSGENLQQTLHRLGIDLPQNVINERNF